MELAMTQRDFSQNALALQAHRAATARAVSLPDANAQARGRNRFPPHASVVYLNALQVRARYGGISVMTLWRWLHDEKLGFPRPTRINRIRFWEDAKLAEWDRKRVSEQAELDGSVEPDAT
jgi:predicted DNA-binding transcriptional regulator AlpA